MSAQENSRQTAGAPAPARDEEPGILIFEPDGQHDPPAPKPAASGGSGSKPPGQSGGSAIGTGGNDDGSGSGWDIQLAADDDGEPEREPAEETQHAQASSETGLVLGADLLGSEGGEQTLHFPTDESAVDEPAPALAGAGEVEPSFGRWDAVTCLLSLATAASFGIVVFVMAARGGLG